VGTAHWRAPLPTLRALVKNNARHKAGHRAGKPQVGSDGDHAAAV
jgi:hypothetical protein